MAPEIFEKKKYDGEAADVFSLGVILFILATGSFPFT
jgi:serine/threonine protein kinase